MARLDIKSFEKGIEKINEQIRKLEERRARLRDKIHNTVECPSCHWHWDALYLVNVTKTIKVAKEVTDEKVEALWICPMCKTQIHQVFKDLSDQWYGEESGEEVLLEGSTDKVTKVKEIRESLTKTPILYINNSKSNLGAKLSRRYNENISTKRGLSSCRKI